MYVEKITKDMFQDVIAFSFSEVGAMGLNGTVGVFTKSGEHFIVNYLSENTPYEKLKECFPALQGCYWNGPMKNERASLLTYVIGGNAEKSTVIPEGYKHMYLDVGNHLCIKEELYGYAKNLFRGKENHEITFEWQELLAKSDIVEKMDDIVTAYQKQKDEDEKLASALKELNQNPEYVRRVKESGDIEGMLAVLKEFSGIDIDFMELKQFGLRQQGLL